MDKNTSKIDILFLGRSFIIQLRDLEINYRLNHYEKPTKYHLDSRRGQ